MFHFTCLLFLFFVHDYSLSFLPSFLDQLGFVSHLELIKRMSSFSVSSPLLSPLFCGNKSFSCWHCSSSNSCLDSFSPSLCTYYIYIYIVKYIVHIRHSSLILHIPSYPGELHWRHMRSSELQSKGFMIALASNQTTTRRALSQFGALKSVARRRFDDLLILRLKSCDEKVRREIFIPTDTSQYFPPLLKWEGILSSWPWSSQGSLKAGAAATKLSAQTPLPPL